MTLNFSKEGNLYVAAATITGDFNLHLEGQPNAQFALGLKTSGAKFFGKYADKLDANGVFEEDFDARIYPKTIRVVSSVALTGSVTFNG